MKQNKNAGDTISISEYFIPSNQRKLPQEVSCYRTVVSKEEFNKMYKGSEEVVMKLDDNTGYFRHKIWKRIVTYNIDGSISTSRSQKVEDYKEYKEWLVDRFKKGQVYKIIEK